MNLFKILLIAALLFGCESSQKNTWYNYQLSTNFNGVYKTVCKGVIDENNIPNGKFEFLSIDDRFTAKGFYKDGAKNGPWEFSLDNKIQTIDWTPVKFNSFLFSLPKSWEITIDSANRITALEEDSAGNKLHEVRFNSYEMDDSKMSFIEMRDSYFEQMEPNFLDSGLDRSDIYLENFGLKKMSLKQFVIKDEQEKKGIVFLLVFKLEKVPNTLFEIAYLAPLTNSDFDFFLFNEIFLDINFSGHSIFDRLQLEILQ